MEVGGLTNRDHEVLGVEYCSGYTDSFGKWNTGFYCPTSYGSGERVYCCGTSGHKYCCTKRDEERASATNQMVLLVVALGALLLATCIVLIVCFLWRRCVRQRKRHLPPNGGPLYRMHCSSTNSGVANMYSFSGQPSLATTPMDMPVFSPDQQSRAARCLLAEPPPPYTTSFNSRRNRSSL